MTKEKIISITGNHYYSAFNTAFVCLFGMNPKNYSKVSPVLRL